MRAIVLSDLHLGTVTRRDLLRRPEARAALMERIADADHVVLLGDVLELRELPLAQVLREAEPFFRELGEAADGAARITIVPGNHDHRLSWPLTDGRADPLRVSASTPVPRTGPLALIADWLGPSETELAYPGIHLRPDVYATHGHFLDCHLELPTFERLAIAATARVVGGDGIRSASDHESACAPLYGLAYSLAQSSRRGPLVGGGRTASTWERLAGENGRRRVGARLTAGLVLPAAVGALNRAGFGPMTADLSGPSLRRTGLRAMAAVAAALGVDGGHVVFGHTHRSGPWPGDDRAEWELAGGGHLLNTGSWIHEPAFVRTRGRQSPYWPGTVAIVDEEGPPRLERLLDDLPPTGT